MWLYKGLSISSIKDLKEAVKPSKPWDLHGFVYEIEYSNGKKYIGKKNFWFTHNLPTRKNKLPREGHIKFYRKRINHKLIEYEEYKKESDWITYEGSLDKDKLGDTKIVKKTILEISKTERYLTYLEAKYLFSNDAIIDDKYLNKNILGTFFRTSILASDSITFKKNVFDGNEYPVEQEKEECLV